MNLIIIALVFYPFFFNSPPLTGKEPVAWLDFLEVQQRNHRERMFHRPTKKTLIYLMDEHNAWCTRMKDEVFSDAELSSIIGHHYYPVLWKVGEEQNEIVFGGTVYQYNVKYGFHEVITLFTVHRNAFPYTVILDEDFRIVKRMPGYRKARDLKRILDEIDQ